MWREINDKYTNVIKKNIREYDLRRANNELEYLYNIEAATGFNCENNIGTIPKQTREAATRRPINSYTSAPATSCVPHAERPRDLSKIVAGWKIKFSGTSGLNVEDFLTMIDEHRQVAAMTENEMLRAIPMLLQAPAINMFRVYGSSWRCYQDFVNEIRRQYQDESYSEMLADQARVRTQGEDEPVIEYINAMRLIFSKMRDPPTELKQVERIYRNMRRDFLPLLRDHSRSNLNTFIERALDADRAFEIGKKYRPPPPSEQSLLTAAAYKPRSSSTKVAAALVPDTGDMKAMLNAINKLELLITSQNSKSKQQTPNTTVQRNNAPSTNSNNNGQNAQGERFNRNRNQNNSVNSERQFNKTFSNRNPSYRVDRGNFHNSENFRNQNNYNSSSKFDERVRQSQSDQGQRQQQDNRRSADLNTNNRPNERLFTNSKFRNNESRDKHSNFNRRPEN